MAYLKYEQIVVNADVKTVDDLTFPDSDTSGTAGAELQADTRPVRYTMDGAGVPAQGVGMVLAVADPPKYFTNDDLRTIKFTRGAGTNGNLNVHYVGGRRDL